MDVAANKVAKYGPLNQETRFRIRFQSEQFSNKITEYTNMLSSLTHKLINK
jgi:hypothetical protein